MTQPCDRIQHLLVDVGGDLDLVSDEVRDHLSTCARCADVARGEAELAAVFQAALPPYDDQLEWFVLGRVAGAASRRRVTRLLPAAAAVLVAMLGLFLLDGIPGSGLLSALPNQCADGALGFGATVVEWLRCFTVAVASLGRVVPGWLAVAAGLLTLAAVVGLRRAAVRLARVGR